MEYTPRLVSCVTLYLTVASAFATDTPSAEIHRLLQRVPDVALVQLPATGSVQLQVEQSLTVDKLRNVIIDDYPPPVTGPLTYAPNMGDGAAEGAEPYVADDIAAFRFHHFQLQWNYAGWYTLAMSDYALQHGFQTAVLYNREPADVPIGGSELLQNAAFSWNNWFATHLRPDGQPYAPQRWDELPSRTELVAQLLAEDAFADRPGVGYVLLDLEDPAYPEEEASLRQKAWYPPGGVDQDFENAYYDGFVDMELAAAETAKQQGWQETGIYGWAPFPRKWFGLESVSVDPNTYWPWTRYGRAIYRSPSVDALHPSVYNFYWEERNVAYVLANIDLNMRLVNSEPVRKAVQPYFWNQLHGGGPGWRWWRGQPLRNEDMRAMIAMTFFTGVDGLTLWNWSNSSNPHVVDIQPCTDYSVGANYIAFAQSGSPRVLRRYEAIHVLQVAAGVARFQVIDMTATRADNYGTDRPKTFSPNSPEGYDHRCWQTGDPTVHPVYAMNLNTLKTLLRPGSESIQPVIEALALVRPLELTLSSGEVHIDISAQEQFMTLAPVVRRVDNGDYTIIATYDPQWQKYPDPRTVVLSNFDGHAGLTLEVPADGETRLFLLRRD